MVPPRLTVSPHWTLWIYSLYTGRGIYLDIALVAALLGFVDTVLVGRYLERRL